MKYIVNLSSIHQDSITARIEAFTQLCDRYSKTLLTENCFALFSHYVINTPWVALKYRQHRSLINEYKIGKLTTEQFLDAMLTIFSFLQSKPATFFEQDDIDHLFQNKERLLSLKGVTNKTDLTGEKIARALLEEAWTSAIRLPEQDRFATLLEQLENDDSICFISNSNEMDINTILRLVKEKYPEISWVDNADISSNPANANATKPLCIASPPNIFIATSYQFKSFKTENDNTSAQFLGTPGLLATLLKDTSGQKVVVVSQYPKDLEQARSLGIPAANCHRAPDFFSSEKPRKTRKMR